jgi:hypothetical protein
LLSRDLSGQKLIDIYRIVPNRMPLHDLTLGESEQARLLKTLLERYQASLEEILAVDAVTALK